MKTTIRLLCLSGFFTVLACGIAPKSGAQPSWVKSFPRTGAWGLDAFHDGRLIVGASGVPDNVAFFSPDGSPLGQFGSRGTGDGRFDAPYFAKLTPDQSKIYVGDFYNNRVQIFSAGGQFQSKFGSGGTGFSQFNGPADIIFLSDGRFLVSDWENNRIVLYTAPGVANSVIVAAGLQKPFGMALLPNGDFLAAHHVNHTVKTHSFSNPTPAGLDTSGPGALNEPYCISVSPDGRIFVSNYGSHVVKIFSSTGQFLQSFGSPGSGSGNFNKPTGIVILPNGRVYVSDTGNDRVTIWQDPQAVVQPKMTASGKMKIKTKKSRVTLRGNYSIGRGTAVSQITGKAGKRNVKVTMGANNSWSARVAFKGKKNLKVKLTTYDKLGQQSQVLKRSLKRT